jgi:hypothetical protein
MSYTQASQVHSSIPAGAGSLKDFSLDEYRSSYGRGSAVLDHACADLKRLGIAIQPQQIKEWADSVVMDSVQPGVTTPSVVTPLQFLQEFLPGFVYVMTAARKIDDFVGVLIAGDWQDEQIVRGIVEQTGSAEIYGDTTNLSYSSFNNNWNTSTIVRFEEGLEVGQLEQMRASAQNLDAAVQKRIGATRSLEINRNLVGFFGFNGGLNNTYGFLNAPGLPAYLPAPTGNWAGSTYLEIVNDLLFAFNQLQTQSQDNVDPRSVATTLAVSTNTASFISRSTDFGYSVGKWLSENYPKCRIVSAPQLNNANGGQNVFYLYADKIEDESTDGGLTWIQPVPTKFRALGVQQLVKSYKEGYSNATAGVMCQRPTLVVRVTGI